VGDWDIPDLKEPVWLTIIEAEFIDFGPGIQEFMDLNGDGNWVHSFYLFDA
jgi:hypothetical protein